jgi:predicted DNA-binding transcriptional regulator AlpA
MLAAPPSAGAGVHAWLFSVARQLHHHLRGPEIMDLLASRVQDCGRPVSRREIQEAVRDSMACAWQPRMDGRPVATAAPKWPALDMELREVIISDGAGVVEFGSKRDVSAMVGCCVRTVDSLMQQGMPHLKLGRRKVRFDLGEVAVWLKQTYGTQRLGRETEQHNLRAHIEGGAS